MPRCEGRTGIGFNTDQCKNSAARGAKRCRFHAETAAPKTVSARNVLDGIARLQDENKAQAETIRLLTEALEPFARLAEEAEKLGSTLGKSNSIIYSINDAAITLNDARRARNALKETTNA